MTNGTWQDPSLAAMLLVQELVMAVWLIAKGFNPSAVAPVSTGDRMGWRGDASAVSGPAA
jgi:hypothetical protein